MSRVFLAFDFGTKSIGVAIGQRITNTAHPLNSLKARDGIPDWNLVRCLIEEWRPDEVIVGLPLNMDGTKQALTRRVYSFASKIHEIYGIMVKLHDERLSTVEACDKLFKKGGFRSLNKDSIDSTSAVIILESYFNRAF